MDDKLRRHLDDMSQRISHGFERLEERVLATLDKSRTDRPQQPAPNADLQQLDRIGKHEELGDLFPGGRAEGAPRRNRGTTGAHRARLDTETAKYDTVAPRLDSDTPKRPLRAFRLGGAHGKLPAER